METSFITSVMTFEVMPVGLPPKTPPPRVKPGPSPAPLKY